MHKMIVYLIRSQNRLVIVKKQITDPDYEELMNTNGGDPERMMHSCKMFCMGYVAGSQNGDPVLNSMQEFQ